MINLEFIIYDGKKCVSRTIDMRSLESMSKSDKGGVLVEEVNMLFSRFNACSASKSYCGSLDTDAVGTCGCKAAVSTVKP